MNGAVATLRMTRLLLFLLLLGSSSGLIAQRNTLLTNMTIQVECTEAIDSLYNFKFDVAEKQFNWLRQQYPDHPLSYFLLGLSEWWKIMPNDKIEAYDKSFTAYMDTTIYKARDLYQEDPTNPEATFFLSAAYGFKSRILADRGHYARATVAAKASLNALNENIELGEAFSPEFLFGHGLYNYFREWIPENKKFLRAVVMFFPKGDKELGIAQLEQVSKEAFYTRIEAMNFLMRIHGSYENNRAAAFPIAKYLHQNFPGNAVFHRYYMKIAFLQNKHLIVEKEAKLILKKIEDNETGYESESGRLASYFLANELRYRGDTLASKENYLKCVDFGHKLDLLHKGYCLLSLEQLAEYSEKEDDLEQACIYYERIIKNAGENKKHASVINAKKKLKKHKRTLKKRS